LGEDRQLKLPNIVSAVNELHLHPRTKIDGPNAEVPRIAHEHRALIQFNKNHVVWNREGVIVLLEEGTPTHNPTPP